MGSPLPPPGAPPMQPMPTFYQQGQPIGHPPPPHMLPQDANGQALRYPLPATPDGRMLSGGRHKKEIKRRTKTGCLTCRKRRIKCDEGHPTCRNCQKSKRECLGYDPIFKTQPGPTNIQPAPTSSTPTTQPATTMAAPFPQPPAGATAGAPQPFDYASAIDPSLEAAAGQNITSEAKLIAPPVKIEEILDVGSGMAPPTIITTTTLTAQQRDDIKELYSGIYATGMDKFLESKWFNSRGATHLLNNPLLCEKYKVLLSRFHITAASDYQANLMTQSLEAHVIWETLMLARQVSASINTTNDPNATVEASEGVHEAAKRVEIFEALVTNQKLDPENGISDAQTQPSSTTTPSGTPKPALEDQLKTRERDFWRCTSKFCTLKDDSKPFAENPSDELEKVVKEMRAVLDSRENRDILYSIAINRYIGHQLAEKMVAEGSKGQAASTQPVGNNEEDPRTKLSVARNFIHTESTGKGTTQVAQRVCGMAVMAWNKRPVG